VQEVSRRSVRLPPMADDQQQVIDVDDAIVNQIGRTRSGQRLAWSPSAHNSQQVVDVDHAVAVDIAGHRSGFPCVQIVAVAGLGMRVRMVSLLV